MTVLEAAKSRKQNVRFGPLFNEACAEGRPAKSSRIRWGRQGIETRIPLPRAVLADPRYPLDRFLINPAFMDCLHQAGAVLAIELTGSVYLPIGADQFVVYEPPRQDTTYRVVARLKELDDQRALYDMVLVRDDGVLCAAVHNSRFHRISG